MVKNLNERRLIEPTVSAAAPADILFPQEAGLSGVFKDLPEAEWRLLLSTSRLRELRKGEFLVRAGEPPDGIYILLKGSAEVLREGRSQRKVTLNQLRPGDVAGEVAHVSNGTRIADVLGLEDCLWAHIDEELTPEFIAQYPSFALHLLRTLATRLTRTSVQAMDLATVDVPTRLLNALERMAVPKAMAGSKYLVIRERPTHTSLAQLVGSSREVVSRSFGILEQAGEIQQRGRMIILLKPSQQL